MHRLAEPRGLAELAIVSVWAHEGRPAELVRELKYGRATSVVSELADAMARRAPSADLVTWVPASRERRRSRGFDQGELLARAVARRLHLPVRRLLRRVDWVPQTARPFDGRLAGPEFRARGARVRPRTTVLLVDDVTTTGSTLRSATAVLQSRGAAQVIGLVATRAIRAPTPAPSRRGVYDQATTHPTGG